MNTEYRKLPSVEQVVSHTDLAKYQEDFPHAVLVDIIREILEKVRQLIADGNPCPEIEEIVQLVSGRLHILTGPGLRPVINASGVLLHTNLGRAPISMEAAQAMIPVATGYSNLEFDLETGRRGSRHVHIEDILCQLTGAEAALVVNNNASGVLLGLSALAKRKEVIVSRGQAVEIGGSFRIPDVMRQSGAKLVEVGTTNCTYAADYEQAVTSRTAALMRVHSSNFRVVGFTHEAGLEEIVNIGRHHDIPVLDDLGSGCFLDTTVYGLSPEPTVQQSIAAGVSLVFFSGDKLVGGPQAGIIVGKRELVNKLKKHPLARAVRTDKITVSVLKATLLHYIKGEAAEKIPAWRMIAAPLDEINRRAERWASVLGRWAEVRDGETMVGGGSLPGGTLPTRLVTIQGGKGGMGVNTLSRLLRNQETPVVGRVNVDMLMLDPRSVLPEDDEIVIMALRRLKADLDSRL